MADTRFSDGDQPSWYEFESLTWISLALHVLVVPTTVVAALYVRRLTAMQAAELGERPLTRVPAV
ncbi:hypothetical protein MTP10_13865 [Nonomuraea sp. 3-1Str]|uniref:hypothetical protein n=1 Tax=Nonomuraea sp. 3-1Str TaxID=2929801 RepID=UPI0028654A74|nr:hypothetical protein [Nonomuraea sp. 3-1Str]MDR8409819.1 hypothetical protein [Nonomuraea sp. 3-1Str]